MQTHKQRYSPSRITRKVRRSSRRGFTVFAGLMLLCLNQPSLYAQQQSVTLREVTINGLTDEQKTLLNNEIEFPIGQEMNAELMEAMKAKLDESSVPLALESMQILPVDANGDGDTSNDSQANANLIINFISLPIISDINIFPLIDVNQSKFRDGISIKLGDRYSQQTEEQTIAELQAVAKEEGFGFSRVVTHYFGNVDGSIDVGYIIEGRSPVDLYKVRFKEAGFGNAVKIRNVLKDPEVMGFDEGSKVTAAKLQEIEKLVGQEIMRSQGYLMSYARLDRTEITEKGAKIVYRLERGNQFDINSINVNSTNLPEPVYTESVTRRFLDKGITAQRLEELQDAVKRKSQKEGFIDPTVEVELGPGEDEETVAVTVIVDEGSEAYMGDAIINRKPGSRGYGDTAYHKKIAPPIKQELIEKQVRTQPGEQLTLKSLDDAERRLWRLGVFEDVQVSTAPTTDTLVRDMVVDVTEKRTANFGASIGWNDALGPVVRGGFSEGNVGGRGDRFAVNAYASLDEESFGGDISYLDRYWKTGEKILGEDREPSLLYFAQYNEAAYNEYIEKTVGGRLRLQYLTGENRDVWSNYIQLRVEDIEYDPHRDLSQYDEDFDDYLAKTISYGIVYDNRNKGDFDSTEGLYAGTGIEFGDANGLLIKWTAASEYHKPLSPKFAYQFGGQLGLMPYDADEVGLADRFQAGGTNSLRGFDTRGIGPVDGQQDDLHTGGSTLATAQNEIRYALSDDVDVPVFLDFGFLDDKPLSPGPLRATTGIGLRVKLPESNQRAFIYYSESLLKEATDDDRSIHFGFKFDL